MNSVGLDVHKTRCVACVKTPEGRILEEFAFQNNSHDHEELITHLKGYLETQIAIESTGNLWIPIYNRLEDEHIHVTLANPKKTRMIAEAKIKTDKLDARILADLLRANLLSPSYIPPPEIRAQRSIIRERARLSRLRTIIKNRIHTLLDKHAYKSPYTDLFGKHGLEWLRKLDLPPTDRTLLEVNLEQVASLNQSIARLTELIAASAVTNPEVKLLMGFTMAIASREFVSIMGASGSGKSSLPHLIGCLDSPTRGSVAYEGVQVSEMAESQLTDISSKPSICCRPWMSRTTSCYQ